MKKTIILLFLVSCASLWAQDQKVVIVVDTTYVWPSNLRGENINIRGIIMNDSGWIFAGTVGNGMQDGLVWRSKDKGKSWEQLTQGLSGVFGGGVLSIYETSGKSIIIGALNGIWRSTDDGDTWTNVLFSKGPGVDVWSFIQIQNGTVFAGGSRLWKSTDDGKTWTNTKKCSRLLAYRKLRVRREC